MCVEEWMERWRDCKESAAGEAREVINSSQLGN